MPVGLSNHLRRPANRLDGEIQSHVSGQAHHHPTVGQSFHKSKDIGWSAPA